MASIKSKILLIVTMVTFFFTLLSATYAYFQVSGSTLTTTSVNVTTYTSDVLTFEVGGPISIETNQTLFASGKGNAVGETYAKTILLANNKTNTVTKNYYLYLNINENTFTYTQNTSTPEILLTVADENDNYITSIEGLTHKTVIDGKGNQVSGFDITNKVGLIKIFDNRSITASSSIVEEWKIKITFLNYNFDQGDNAGKKLNARLLLQKEKIVLLADYVKSKYTGIQGVNGMYLHNSSLTNGAGDESYRYAGANPNNYVCFGTNITPCPNDNLYRIIGVFGSQVKLIKYDYATSDLLGIDGDYKGPYSHGSDSYKGYNYANISSYYWNYNNDTVINGGNGSNTWSTSLLNITNLNYNFLREVGTDWEDKISEFTWKVGGNSIANIVNLSMESVYQNEIINPVATNTTDHKTEYKSKIGLMYLSDYGYAASSSFWGIGLDSYARAINENWVYMGLFEWSITRFSLTSNGLFNINSNGSVNDRYVGPGYAVRPCFYLNTNVMYVSGTGEIDDPIILL